MYHRQPKCKVILIKELQFSIKIMGHRNYHIRIFDKIREIQQRREWMDKREEDEKRLVGLQGNDNLDQVSIILTLKE